MVLLEAQLQDQRKQFAAAHYGNSSVVASLVLGTRGYTTESETRLNGLHTPSTLQGSQRKLRIGSSVRVPGTANATAGQLRRLLQVSQQDSP